MTFWPLQENGKTGKTRSRCSFKKGMCPTHITVVTQGSQRCLTLSIVPRHSGQIDGGNPNESSLKTELPLLCVEDAPYRIPFFSIAVGLGHAVAVELQFNVPRQ